MVSLISLALWIWVLPIMINAPFHDESNLDTSSRKNIHNLFALQVDWVKIFARRTSLFVMATIRGTFLLLTVEIISSASDQAWFA